MPLPALILALAALPPQERPAAETALPEVKVKAKAGSAPERADGPVKGYRARRSATVTKTDTPLRDVPQSVQVVPEALVKDQAMTSMAEVIRTVPGASMNPGEGGRDQPVLRGISTTSDFYVDGLRDDALYFRDPYNAERIEILKGPSGMAFGRGGAGGVVNRVLKRPLEAPQGRVDLTLGSWAGKRLAVDYSDRMGQLGAFRVNGVVEDAKGFRDGFMLRRSGIHPVGEFIVGADTLALVSLEHFEDRRTTDRGIPALNGRPYDTDRATFFGNPDQSPSTALVDAFGARVEHALAPGITLRNALRVTRYDLTRQNVQANSVVNPTTGLVRLSAYRTQNERLHAFNQTEVEWRTQAAGLEHLILAGLEVGHQTSDSTRITGYFGASETTWVDARTPRATVTSWAPKASDTHNEVRGAVAAVYLQDQVRLSDTWKAVLGARYDRFSVAVDDLHEANVDLDRTDTALSPKAGLIYQPGPASSYYLSWGTSFLPSSETLSLSVSNADLKPETAINWELGAKWDLADSTTLTAAAFRTDRADVKSKDPNDPTRLILSGLQRAEGLEVGLQGQVTPAWQVYAGYAWMDARVVKATGGSATTAPVPAGTRVPLVPRNAATWWNRVTLGDRWSLGLGLVHQGQVHASTTNAVTLPGYTRVDGALYCELGRSGRLALHVENLFDRHYFSTAGGDFNILVGSPRKVQVAWSVRFR